MLNKDVIMRLNKSSYAFRSFTREVIIKAIGAPEEKTSKETLLDAIEFAITQENSKNREYIAHLVSTIFSNVEVLMMAGDWTILNTLSGDLLRKTITAIKNDTNYAEDEDNLLYGVVQSLETELWFANLSRKDKMELKRIHTFTEQNHQDFL